jgi:starch synthase
VKIAHVASEVAPWSQSGGLADVAGALPRALAAAGAEVAVFSPLYRGVRDRAAARGTRLTPIRTLDLPLGKGSHRVTMTAAETGAGPALWFVDAPALYDRDGLYSDATQRDYDDNAVRFAVLAAAAIAAAPEALGGPPDVFHAHDWQAGLVPLWTEVPSVLTIHNLAYRGLFDKAVMTTLGLPWSRFTLDELEYFDQLSFLKAGIAHAAAVTTVSPSYAREILEPGSAQDLAGFLAQRARRLTGILNGIDTEAWNPATDPALPARYSRDDLDGKRACRQALARELDLTIGPDTLLVGAVSRFAEQKGLDLVADLVPELTGLGVSLVVLGTGEPALEDRFRRLAAEHPTALTARIGFDVGLARRIYAGCDALLMPSRFEPCGLNQLYAMRYGTVPIVHAVGGLRDTVDGTTGIRFDHADAAGLRWALTHASQIFRGEPAAWRAMVGAGMERDWSWGRSARAYLDLYRQIVT